MMRRDAEAAPKSDLTAAAGQLPGSTLTEGVDGYFLAKQMGTSVKMIEDHYGHVTPVKNANGILQGLPGWDPIAAAPLEAR
jgi:hypothetical protein